MTRPPARGLGGAARSVIIGAVVGIALFAGAFVASTSASRFFQPATSAAPPSAGLPSDAGVSRTDRSIGALQERLRLRPSNGGQTALALAYLQKARETGDPSYYTRADGLLREAFEADPVNVDALVGLGSLALARHDFPGALEWGRRAVAAGPATAAGYGIVGDALTELGQYEEALATIQRMVDVRPDQASYSRVSYVRELFGDVEGAIEAMRLAAQTGAPGAEGTEWARVQLGHLHFGRGDLAGAHAAYTEALVRLPGYVHALGGLARVAAARGDYAAAIRLYGEATESVPLPELVIQLGEVYRAIGRTEEADRQDALVGVMQRLNAANGMDTDLEVTLFDADRSIAPDATVARARALWESRRSIQVADALAWALYRSGACADADARVQDALRLGTRDALMRFHAGQIAACIGDSDRAASLLGEALAINPHFSLRWGSTARAALRALGKDVPE